MSKKLIIAFSALALAILAGAIAVVGVFAAQQQKVANTFTITYTANNVSASVGGIYKMKDGTGGGLIGELYQGNQSNTVYFEPKNESQTKTFSSSQINLTASNDWIILYFYIMNRNSTGGKNMTASLSCSATYENVEVWFGVGNVTTYEDAKLALSVYPSSSFDPSTYVETNTVPPQTELPLYFCIKIIDNTLPASFVSTADAGINITLNSAS